MASKLHFLLVPAAVGLRLGCKLLSWTSDAVVVAKPKRSLLPVLVVLFLVSYGLMSLLVVEQGRTIDNQRSLIQSLLDDSNQLSQLKGKASQQQHAAAQAQAEAKTHSQAQNPSTQAKPRDNAKDNHNTGKLRKPFPQKPPVGTADNTDERRTVLTI